jgi:hypothetical protein
MHQKISQNRGYLPDSSSGHHKEHHASSYTEVLYLICNAIMCGQQCMMGKEASNSFL